jgi:hypothetical protein
MTDVRVLEQVSRNAPLGIRFWDVAAATSTVYGLNVDVFRRDVPWARATAAMNRSGTYVAHLLPGAAPPPDLRAFEFSDADPDVLWSGPTRQYRIEVRDPQGRFLPIAFDAELPWRGLLTFLGPWLSPPRPVSLPTEPGSPPPLLLERVPLFSAPSRPLPEPLAVVYAQMREQGSGRDLAWALLTVAIDGRVRGIGLADGQGRVAVMFPYPEPPRQSLASPPEERNDFTWQLSLTAFWSAASPAGPVTDVPDLADVFGSLSTPRAVIESTVSPAAPLRLAYREALTARTAGTVGADASLLFVS